MLKLIKWSLIILVGGIVLLGIADGIRNLSETNEETFQRHLKANHLDSAEDILKKNPNLQIDGRKGFDLLAEKKAAMEAERIAKEIAEAERLAREKAEGEKRAAEQLALAQSNGYNTYEEYRAAEASKIAEADRLAKEKAEAERQEKILSEKLAIVDRDELNRVLNKPEIYAGKIIRFKDPAVGDHIVSISIDKPSQGTNKLRPLNYMKIRGANWSKKDLPPLMLPTDIYNKLENDFYEKAKLSLSDYETNSNEFEMVSLSRKEVIGINGSSLLGIFDVEKPEYILVITRINVYNRDLGMYQTKIVSY